MDELLLDYALNQLPPGDRAVVSNLIATDPEIAAKFRTVSALLAPLAADREPDAPPPDLALSAIALTAEHLVANGLFTAKDGFPQPADEVHPDSRYRESRWWPLVRGWVNVGVIAAVMLLTLGLGLTGVQKARQSYQQSACQNNLRELHGGLVGYSDAHEGRFPQVGSEGVPTAGAFYTELARSGQPLPESVLGCPIQRPDAFGTPVGYTYTLGFKSDGRLFGLQKPQTAEDLTPIASDLPSGGHSGWNVLTVGGSVHLTRTSVLGSGDDLFRNDAGRTAAGLHRLDVCLGRPFDVP